MKRRLSSWLYLAALVIAPATARADVDGKLASYEQEAKAIGTDLPRPNTITGAAPRRLVDAEVAFALGDYDNAALMLFDLASKPGAEQETALYYLAESLFQKGDKGAGRAYYVQVVAMRNTAGKYYEPSLLRLIEISIAQSDPTDVDTNLAALSGSSRPAGPVRPRQVAVLGGPVRRGARPRSPPCRRVEPRASRPSTTSAPRSSPRTTSARRPTCSWI